MFPLFLVDSSHEKSLLGHPFVKNRLPAKIRAARMASRQRYLQEKETQPAKLGGQNVATNPAKQ